VDKLTEIIKDKVRDFGLSPYEINTGSCDNFADSVLDEAKHCGLDVSLREDENVGHIWVVYKGRHYDAEVPKGVSDWKELPIIKRNERGIK